ncbi:MAG: ABC transporter ATP-binding protein/permease [Phycisphaerales bacterium]|nr:ABC transporter ATP-binding protein/permease [Phycisphaerales bacterium]
MISEPRLYGAAIVAMVLSALLMYLVPLIPQVVIDGVLLESGEGPSSFERFILSLLGGSEFVGRNLWWPGLVILFLSVLAGAFAYFRGAFSAKATERIVQRMRDSLYQRLQRAPVGFIDRSETGDLIQRCTSDVDTVRIFLSAQVVEVARAIAMLIVPLPFMLLISPVMTLASVVLLPLIVLFALFYFKRIRVAFLAVDEAEADLTSTVQENISGIRVVRAFAQQEQECEKFDGRNGRHRDLDNHLYRVLAWFWSISDLMCMAQKIIVVGLGLVLLGLGHLEVGAFFFFLTVVSMFVWPIRQMGRILADLGKAQVALGRIGYVLEQPEESHGESGIELSRESLAGAISFQGVTFSHPESDPVLHDIDFEVAPGSTIALVGPSGCGKSTIINLLMRFYEPDEGSIELDGIKLSEIDRTSLRSNLSVVMQEPFLYSRSLMENLAMGRDGAEEREIVEATTVASIHDSIMEFEEGYSTVVGERGLTLSGGQRQRLSIARALLRDPAVLVLDDALSAVDTKTERAILAALEDRKHRHTTILIAHRLTTVMQADEVLVLDQGRIVDRGSHDELLKRQGIYRRFWDIQHKGMDSLNDGSSGDST